MRPLLKLIETWLIQFQGSTHGAESLLGSDLKALIPGTTTTIETDQINQDRMQISSKLGKICGQDQSSACAAEPLMVKAHKHELIDILPWVLASRMQADIDRLEKEAGTYSRGVLSAWDTR